MLLRFEVSNHRSILEPAELSMVVAADYWAAATRQSACQLPAGRILTIAGIHGPASSGKSNVLEALAWLSAAVGRSLRTWDGVIPREPFRLSRGLAAPSAYEVELLVSGVRYAYRLEVNDVAVQLECLYSWSEGRRRVLFEREGGELRSRRGPGALPGVRELLTPTTLALSAALKSGEPEVRPFGLKLAGISMIGLRRGVGWRQPLAAARTSTSPAERQLAAQLSRHLGSPDGTEPARRADRETTAPARAVTPGRLRLVHGTGQQGVAADPGWEPADARPWSSLIGPTLGALRAGQVLLVDGLDASIRPRLSARLLDLFRDQQANRDGAQLIFTARDPDLLSCLNPDEIWFTRKRGGATTLTAHADHGARRAPGQV